MEKGARLDDSEKLKQQILDEVAICRKCRMCVSMCPTYDGWFTESSMGRLAAINLHFKHGLGDAKELSDLLYACASCRRCQQKCKMVSVGVSPADIIVKARRLLVKETRDQEQKKHEKE